MSTSIDGAREDGDLYDLAQVVLPRGQRLAEEEDAKGVEITVLRYIALRVEGT